ncbi:Thymidine kinase [Trichostrongylus colubriformis]|uniref:Thymidine kinase n=1 Tax=Trichostrongylus colubriformis TaxID=6319 RepID=A0AAN8FGD1_TRICO
MLGTMTIGFSDIRRGHVVCIVGPMFSGKTTELIRMHDRYRIAGKNCVLFDDLSYTCEQLACEGKMVLVAALDGNFLRKPFVEVSQLISFSDEIKKLSAVCMDCGDDAPFTFRCTNEEAVEVIGGEDTYRALCRTCYYTRSIQKDCRRSKRG